MSLIICSVCGKQVSDHALMCPGCGEPDPSHYHMRNDWLIRLFWLGVWVAFFSAIWIFVVPIITDVITP